MTGSVVTSGDVVMSGGVAMSISGRGHIVRGVAMGTPDVRKKSAPLSMTSQKYSQVSLYRISAIISGCCSFSGIVQCQLLSYPAERNLPSSFWHSS